MKVKDGFEFAENKYEVRIGGVLADDYYSCVVTGAEAEIIFGDVNGDGSVKTNDLVFLKRHLAAWAGYAETDINYAAADCNDDGSVKTNDLVFLKRHLAAWPGYETLPYKN